jgi:hypothetical protein
MPISADAVLEIQNMKGKIMRKHLVSLCFLLTVLILAAVMPVAVSAADTRPSVYAGEGDGIVLDGIREDSYGEPVEVSKAGVAHNADMPLTTAKLSVAWEATQFIITSKLMT